MSDRNFAMSDDLVWHEVKTTDGRVVKSICSRPEFEWRSVSTKEPELEILCCDCRAVVEGWKMSGACTMVENVEAKKPTI